MSGWEEYKHLVIKELERTDENSKVLLEAVQRNCEKLSSIATTLESLDKTMTAAAQQAREVEKNMTALEKDFSSLKAKILILGGGLGLVVTAVINVAIQYFK